MRGFVTIHDIDSICNSDKNESFDDVVDAAVVDAVVIVVSADGERKPKQGSLIVFAGIIEKAGLLRV